MTFQITNIFIIKDFRDGVAVFAQGEGEINLCGGNTWCAKRVSNKFTGENEVEQATQWIKENATLVGETIDGSRKSNAWLNDIVADFNVRDNNLVWRF